MRHFFLVDPLDKLYVSVDTSLLLATTMKNMGLEVYILFEKDFFIDNQKKSSFHAYSFSSEMDENLYKHYEFKLAEVRSFLWQEGDVLHMRLDPPFDSRYLRILWMLKSLKGHGVKVVNDPEGIMLFNEKLYAYEQEESCPSLVGSSLFAFKRFTQEMKGRGFEALILKPLDLYQGKGVERFYFKDHGHEDLEQAFVHKVEAFKGPIVVQPYLKSVEQGEVRATYFKETELASVLKMPVKGDFLANMMNDRAKCKKIDLTFKQKEICDRIAKELASYGVDWIAFDLMGDMVSEVNITCPGLIGESAREHDRNLFQEIVKRAQWS